MVKKEEPNLDPLLGELRSPGGETEGRARHFRECPVYRISEIRRKTQAWVLVCLP